MTKLEWIIFEKHAKKIKIITLTIILTFIFGTIAYWYLDRDVVDKGCTYIVATTGEKLTEGDWMPVRPTGGDTYITLDGGYIYCEFHGMPYGQGEWIASENVKNKLQSIAGRPVQ